MIGVFGGSGFYELLSDCRAVEVDTPYGAPAAAYTIGKVDTVEVVFLPRHGQDHQFPPHKVPYRANVWGMKELGVTCIIGPCAVGSLQQEYAPGSYLVASQLIDWTTGRERTFYDGPEVEHLSFADPYCAELRTVAIEGLRAAKATVHDGGTIVVVQGPRFSSRAESGFFSKQGWSVINMTQEPEVALCGELGMCYVNISVVTDYDVGVVGQIPAVTHEEVLDQFDRSLGKLRQAILQMIPRMEAAHSCSKTAE